MNNSYHEQQKRRNKEQLSKAKKLYEIAYKIWRKAWLEKNDNLNAAYDNYINADADVAYLDFQKYLLNKP